MSLAAPYVFSFVGGATELRIGPLSSAGRLGPSHSVGAITKAGITDTPEIAKQKGGAPQYTVDQFISGHEYVLTVDPAEHSVRNLNVALGNGVSDYNTPGGDIKGVLDTTSAVTAGTTALVLKASPVPGAFTTGGGDVVTVYSATDPGKVTVATTASWDSVTKTLTLATGEGLVSGFAAGEVVEVYKATTLGASTSAAIRYFSASIITVHHATGRAIVNNVWKCSLESGFTYDSSMTEFSKPEWKFGILLPAASDYAAGGPLAHVADRVAASGPVEVVTVLDFL